MNFEEAATFVAAFLRFGEAGEREVAGFREQVAGKKIRFPGSGWGAFGGVPGYRRMTTTNDTNLTNVCRVVGDREKPADGADLNFLGWRQVAGSR